MMVIFDDGWKGGYGCIGFKEISLIDSVKC